MACYVNSILIKLLPKTLPANIQDVGLGKELLDLIPEVQSIEKNKVGLITVKKVCPVEEPSKRMERKLQTG